MQILKLLAAFSFALAYMTAEASPILQLGITNGGYDADAGDVVTTENIFSLNAFGKSGKNGVNLDDFYFISIAILADEELNPADFGTFNFAGTSFTAKDMVFGNPPFESNQGFEGGDLSPHGIFDTWFLQYAFQFSSSNLTSVVKCREHSRFRSTR